MKHHRPIVEYIRVPLRCLQTDLPFAVMFATHPRTGRVWFDHISPDNGNSAAPPNRDLRKLPWDGVRCPHCAAGIAVGISVTPTASVTVGATSVTVGVTGVVTMISSALRRMWPGLLSRVQPATGPHPVPAPLTGEVCRARGHRSIGLRAQSSDRLPVIERAGRNGFGHR